MTKPATMSYYVPVGVGPLQVDFPDDCSPERKGALHIRPRSAIDLTKAELEYLKKNHKAVADRLVDSTPVPAPRLGKATGVADESGGSSDEKPDDPPPDETGGAETLVPDSPGKGGKDSKSRRKPGFGTD